MRYNTSAKIRLYSRTENLEYTNLLFSLKCFGNRYQSFFSAANSRFIAQMLGLPQFGILNLKKESLAKAAKNAKKKGPRNPLRS